MRRLGSVLGVLALLFLLAQPARLAAQQQRPAQPPAGGRAGGGAGTEACGEGCGGDTQAPIVDLIAPTGDVYASTASITVDWCDDESLSSTSRWVKVNNVAQTTDYVNNTPLQDCGVRKKSTATSVSLNLGQNTIQAHICDNSSNCTTQTFSVTRRAGPMPVVSLGPYASSIQDYARCAMACFAATYAQGTVPYFSLDQPRSVVLAYHGDRVNPRPFVHVDVTHGGDGTNLPSYFYLKVLKTGGTAVTFLNGETSLHFSAASGAALRLGAQFDAIANSMGTTGVYDVTVVVGASYSGGIEEVAVATRVIVINENDSPIGRGWTIAGLPKLALGHGDSVLVVEGDGSATYFTRAGSSYSSPAGDFSALSVTGSGSSTVYTRRYPDSTAVVFNYLGRLSHQVDRWGDTLAVGYDGSGRLSTITDPAGKTYGLSYGSYGLQAITDPYSRVTGVTVVSNHTLTAITDPDNVATAFAYDDSLRLWKVTDRRGTVVSELTYHDASGRLTAVAGPTVGLYGGASQRPTTTLSSWQLVGVPYASTSGTPAASPLADTVRATVTDAEGHATRFTANAFGQPLVTTNPLGTTVTVSYSSAGLPSSVADQLGVSSSFNYDGTGFMTSATVAGVTTNARNGGWALADSIWGDGVQGRRVFLGPRGRVDSVRVAGNHAFFTYDAHGRVTASYDVGGHFQGTTAYAGVNGNRSQDSLAGNRVTRYGYDQYGRLDSVQATGQPWRVTTFDVLNRPTQVHDGVNTYATLFAYDSLFLRSVTDPMGQVYAFRYNPLGWVMARVDPQSRADSFEYDRDGQLRRSFNRRGQAIVLGYDGLHRPRSRTGGADGPDTTEISSDARVVTVSNAVSAETAFLNATTRRPDSVRTVLTIPGVGSRTYWQRYAHRADGLLDSAYASGPSGTTFLNRRYGYHASRYSLDSLRLGADWTVITRNADGQQTSVRFPTSGDSIFNSVLPNHDVSRLRSSLVGGLNDFYHYDDNGRLDQLDRLGSDVRLYEYDGLGRLSLAGRAATIDSVCTAAGDDGFWCYVPWDSARTNSYDAAGNRTAAASGTWGGSPLWSTTGSYDTGNRITGFGGCTYTTDEDGNVTGRTCAGDTLALAWSADGRLTSVTRNGVTTAFRYDAGGRLVRRDSAGGTTSNFLWDGPSLFAELGPAGDSTRSQYAYYPGLDHLHAFAFRGLGSWHAGYAHTDALGNVRAIADGVTYYRRYEYDEWGVGTGLETGSPLSGDLDRARWKGALYAAPEAGLYYLRNRWYEPRSGRFLSEDPIGLAGGINPYAFAGADPVGGSDPEGLCTRTTITAGGQTSAPRVFCDAWAAFPWDTWEGCYRTRGERGELECAQERYPGASEATECTSLAAAAGQIAAGSSSVAEFAIALGRSVAGVDGTPASLRTGGADLLNPDHSLRGGFRPELGGDDVGQARHFAATLASIAQLPDAVAWLGWYRNEHFGRRGASPADWNLSRQAFTMMGQLRAVDMGTGARPAPAALRLSGGAVRSWILAALCTP